jgi:hypothetical protein
VLALAVALPAHAAGGGGFGSPGLGDPFFRLAGNGGYDVGHSSASCATGSPSTATATRRPPTSSPWPSDSHRNLNRFFQLWLDEPGRVGTADPAAARQPAAALAAPQHRRR